MYESLISRPSAANRKQPFSIRLDPMPVHEKLAYIDSVCATLIESRFGPGWSTPFVMDVTESPDREPAIFYDHYAVYPDSKIARRQTADALRREWYRRTSGLSERVAKSVLHQPWDAARPDWRASILPAMPLANGGPTLFTARISLCASHSCKQGCLLSSPNPGTHTWAISIFENPRRSGTHKIVSSKATDEARKHQRCVGNIACGNTAGNRPTLVEHRRCEANRPFKGCQPHITPPRCGFSTGEDRRNAFPAPLPHAKLHRTVSAIVFSNRPLGLNHSVKICRPMGIPVWDA